MQLPIIKGVYADNADYRIKYPVNLMPINKNQGISNGYLRPFAGVKKVADTSGSDRGGMEWKGKHLRVSGSSLIDYTDLSSPQTLGDVGLGNDTVSMDYSFDLVSISSNNNLYYYDGSSITQVIDTDLGNVIDHIWVDGYFMTTDGEFVVVTDLDDPYSINPTKYGSSEVDPDDVVALAKLRNEPFIINRHTIEVMENVGGNGFPFRRVDGAQVTKGAISKDCVAVFDDSIIFLGGGRGEPISLWATSGGSANKLANQEIDYELSQHTDLSSAKVETIRVEGYDLILVSLPNKTLVYNITVSGAAGSPVWFVLSSSAVLGSTSAYDVHNFVYFNGKHLCASKNRSVLGELSFSVGSQWGIDVSWDFSTSIVYNNGKGAIFHEIELVVLNGKTTSENPTVCTRYSLDGVTWSNPKFIKSARNGQRRKRLVWLSQGNMANTRIQRFMGTSETHCSFSRLEARLEALN